MLRRRLIVAILLAAVFARAGLASAEGGAPDSVAVASDLDAVPATVAAKAPPIWHPTRADTLMFQSVSRRVKPDATARVFSQRGNVEVLGRAMNLRGVHTLGQPESSLLWTDVTKVQVRHSAAGTGAIVGGLLFGAAGLIGMAAMTHDCGSFEITCGASSGDVVAGTLGAFAVGTLVGAVLGAPFHQWKDVPIDRDVRSQGRSTFDDLRHGFTLELAVGPGWASVSNTVYPDDQSTDVAASTRFRLGHGFSERWTLAYVNDVSVYHGFTGITGLGVSRFTAPSTPSLTLELVGGVATRQNDNQAMWEPGIQAGLGFEFSRHWLLRASILHASFDNADWNVVSTSIGRLWY